jgi:hypothetical protein
MLAWTAARRRQAMLAIRAMARSQWPQVGRVLARAASADAPC